MEAAGIEPASRCPSAAASTCVVGHLFLAPLTSDRQDECRASLIDLVPARKGGLVGTSSLIIRHRISANIFTSSGSLIKRPKRSCYWQLKVVSGF